MAESSLGAFCWFCHAVAHFPFPVNSLCVDRIDVLSVSIIIKARIIFTENQLLHWV